MNSVRTRFAPSPTGIMHIGNVRAALLNFLFAKQNKGTFLLRIEDTDAQRNIAHGTDSIIKHLRWLHLNFTEGPTIGGEFGPYFQSERASIYQEYLQKLISKELAYRCFCTPEELELRRNRQIALKKPPRYESTCAKLTIQEIEQKLASKTPFIWRMKTDANKKIFFKDMARGILEFNLQHFSDFPLTREDGSFTFIFANCVDDITMQISHVFRGEEHLSNTVSQTVLYEAFDHTFPAFWHLPILCNLDGKKLSKRDKGFSLDDVHAQGFLPEAICNYLAILGTSFEKEIMNLDEIAATYKFDHLHGISQIRYDMDKLKWINHKWIASYDLAKLTHLCKPFLAKHYDIKNISDQALQTLIKSIQNDMHTLVDAATLLAFYFKQPVIDKKIMLEHIANSDLQILQKILQAEPTTDDWNSALVNIKAQAKAANIPDKSLYAVIRILITGSPKGMQLADLFSGLGKDEFFKRLKK